MSDRFHLPRRALLLLALLAIMIVSGASAAAAVAAPSDAQLAMGDKFSMLIKPDGSLWAWGNNQYGQLGLGVSGTARPLRVGSGTDWAHVETGRVHAIAVKTDGTLWAWGNNAFAQLGLGDLVDRSAPTQVGTDTDWAAVATGLRFSYGLKADGSLWAWGQNDHGQLGLGDTAAHMTPARVGLDVDWAKVDGGGQFATAIKADGTLWAWGRNDVYQLGQGDVTDRHVPTQIGTDTDWSWVGSSDRDSRALKTGDGLWAWGYNNFGQLGLGDVVTRQVPTEVGGSWAAMTVGDDSTLATLPDDTLWAWGDNTYGQLGQGDTDHRNAPTQVGTDDDWVVVGSGHDHVGAIREDGGLWTWGKNGEAQLGLGDRTDRPLPTFAFYVDDYTAPTISSLTSPTHPVDSVLYANALPTFTWQASADQSSPPAYSWTFNASAAHTPDTVANGAAATWTAPQTADGTWYFHVRAGDAAGNWGPAAHKKIMIDATPPVTTDDAPATWSKTPVTVRFTASDAGAGVAGTQYRLDGGAWTSGTQVIVSGDGVHTLLYRSTDALGTVEASKSCTVRIDATPPVTTDDAPATWSKTPVTVHFAASDADAGVAGTEYQIGGGTSWTSGSQATVSGNGVHTLLYRSTDKLGTVEAYKSATVRIDTMRPTTVAPRSASVRRGRYVTLKYRVNDARPGSPNATVTIKIKTLSGKTVKQVTIKNRQVNTDLGYRFRCTLAKRVYRFYVLAKDTAGNTQSSIGKNRLTVR